MNKKGRSFVWFAAYVLLGIVLFGFVTPIEYKGSDLMEILVVWVDFVYIFYLLYFLWKVTRVINEEPKEVIQDIPVSELPHYRRFEVEEEVVLNGEFAFYRATIVKVLPGDRYTVRVGEEEFDVGEPDLYKAPVE